MKFCFATLGCKVNQFETQALAQLAQQRGHVLAEKQADVCIINTCTVTSSGDHKTLRVLHKLQKENPNAIVALCGCFAQTEPEQAAAMDGVKNRWQELWFVTLPLMRNQMMFSAVMSITSAFGVGAVITGLFGSPSTDYAVHTIMNHLEDYGGTRFEMGYASAIATLLFIIMVGTNLVVRKLVAKVGS